MTTLLISHPASLQHITPVGHPERADRMRAIERVLEGEVFQHLARAEPPVAPLETVLLAHDEPYAEALEHARPREGSVRIDADTVMSPGTWEAALRGVGGAVMAVDEVMQGRVRNAFLAMRPPGHHAERRRAMGFCFFNNAAIAARHAQKAYGAERVAIMDFDVHHGNGTQDIFWDDKSVLYASTHEMPLYPGTGAASETGAGNIVNAPLQGGSGGAEFRAAMSERILPVMRAFSPDLVIISAGFDAHARDPLASLNLREDDFAWATTQLMDIADASASGRVVSVLEGGYDLEGLARSTAAHVTALMRG